MPSWYARLGCTRYKLPKQEIGGNQRLIKALRIPPHATIYPRAVTRECDWSVRARNDIDTAHVDRPGLLYSVYSPQQGLRRASRIYSDMAAFRRPCQVVMRRPWLELRTTYIHMYTRAARSGRCRLQRGGVACGKYSTVQ